MKRIPIAVLLGLAAHLSLISASAAEEGFRPLFNGKDLTGWDGNPAFWSVKDGCITGATSGPDALTYNQFLIWRGGTLKNFELHAKIKESGSNSGIQYRSKELPEVGKWSVGGYQLDIHPAAGHNGSLYEERGRGVIASNGESVIVDPAGKRRVIAKHAPVKVDIGEWHDYEIIANGNHLIQKLDGQVTMELADHEEKARALEGVLAFQIHRGPAMNVQIKDVMLKELPDGGVTEFGQPAKTDTPAAPVKKRKAGTRGVAAAPPAGGSATANVKVSPGFKVETIYEVPLAEQGSWVSLTVDPKGRLLASDQDSKGLYRITLPATPDGKPEVEKMPVPLTGAEGLAWESGALYFYKNGGALYRVTDSNNDSLLDKSELISPVVSGGEHGTHAVLAAEDGKRLYTLGGNRTPLPAAKDTVRRRVSSWGEDQLLPRQWDPRGHARGTLAPGGRVTLFDPVTKTHEVYCGGFRNPYDIGFNALGDMFTFDADMEWDMGMPWYRPTRICQVVSGGDYGWRSGSGKWPAYYEDSLPPVVDIGPGSPTGVVVGTGAKFPAKYQRALFALDWTFGRIFAIHLQPAGAGYKADVETFISGAPLAVTDAIIGKDGALYFTVGGRGSRSALLRVTYTGSESTAPAPPDALPPEALTRRQLEVYHGVESRAAVAAAWPHLSSPDRFLRNAAREAIEAQPVATWAGKVFAETNPQARITAAVALARSGTPEMRGRLVKFLLDMDFKVLPVMQKLGVLRGISLAFDRLGKPDRNESAAVIAALDPYLPSDDANVNADILRLLVYLDAPSAAAKGMALIANSPSEKSPDWESLKGANARYFGTLARMSNNPPPTARLRYAFALRNARSGWTPELRRAYFTFLNTAGKAAGGASYPGYLANTRDEALALCTDAERTALQDLTGEDFNPKPDFTITPPAGPGRTWTTADAVATAGGELTGVHFARGRNLFHAVGCASCHRVAGLGGNVGPDLTSVPNKFNSAYLIESIIEPSKVISDQYGSSIVTLKDGRTLAGLVVPQDEKTLRIYPPDAKSEGELVSRTEVKSIAESPVSQMPPGLINSLNPSELRELIAYVMAAGNPKDKIYVGKKRKK